jgi:hypothetical protein
VVQDEGDSEEVSNKNSELLFLKGELDRLKEDERSIKRQKKKSASDKERRKMVKKLKKISAEIEDTNGLIDGVMTELDALKQHDDGTSYVNPSSDFELLY